MSRIPELLIRIRDTLADPHKQRWSDERIIRLIDEAQKSIARRFEILHGEADIVMQLNQSTYQLPDDLWFITRAEFDGVKLEMFTYDEMDCKDPSWQSHTGPRLEALVFDKRNPQEIRIYPLPNDEFDIDYYDIKPQFGVVTQIENVSTSDFGVVGNIGVNPGQQVSFNSPFGVIGDMFTMALLKIRYIRDPRTVKLDIDDLELPPMFDTAIKFYAIGHAFMDDLDTQYQEKGRASLALYDAEAVTLGTRMRTTSGTRADNHRTAYRGFR